MPDPVNTVLPVVSGSTVADLYLSCSQGTWTNSPSSYAYQWQIETAVNSGIYTNISQATGNLYRLLNAQAGLRIRCQVTASNDALLPWSPPVLTSPITLNPTNGNSTYNLTAGQDYIINLPGTPLTTTGGLLINGGRNIVIIGGEIVNNSPNLTSSASPPDHYGIYCLQITGTLHIEGVYIHGTGMGQAIVHAGSTIVQIQNCRFETLHPVTTWIHTDGQQSWAGPQTLRQYQVTTYSAGTAMQMQPSQFSAHTMTGWDYRRINWIAEVPDTNLTPGSYGLWKGQGNGAKWGEYHEQIWYHSNPHHIWASMNSSWADGNCWTCWNPGGSWPITGEEINIGFRPAGDYVGVSDCGIGYVSPGYV